MFFGYKPFSYIYVKDDIEEDIQFTMYSNTTLIDKAGKGVSYLVKEMLER